LKWEMGDDCIVVHLTLVPYLSAAGELKTKPTQHSVKQLLESGVQPDILVCRTEHEIPQAMRTKIAKFCNVAPNAVIQSIDADTIYDVPMLMLEEKFDEVVMEKLNVKSKKKHDLKKWVDFLHRFKNPKHRIEIALVGKYVELKDSYKSISESIIHAGAAIETKVDVRWVHSEELTTKNIKEKLGGVSGILVAPGFGSRGIDGKLEAVHFARVNGIPFFGICLGMQCAVIEFARNVLGLKEAHSTEIKEYTAHPVINLMAEQKTITNMGGTMRLGTYDCKVKKGTLAHKAYGNELIEERHRHRFEFNNEYLSQFEKAGMIASGINPDSGLVEIVEIPSHRYFLAGQFHPEYKSTVANPHPLFVSFLAAALEYAKEKKTAQKVVKEKAPVF
jgi:CTP synthase